MKTRKVITIWNHLSKNIHHQKHKKQQQKNSVLNNTKITSMDDVGECVFKVVEKTERIKVCKTLVYHYEGKLNSQFLQAILYSSLKYYTDYHPICSKFTWSVIAATSWSKNDFDTEFENGPFPRKRISQLYSLNDTSSLLTCICTWKYVLLNKNNKLKTLFVCENMCHELKVMN